MRLTETIARISIVAGAALAVAACASQYKQSEAQIQTTCGAQ
jgi:hypothetical protein